MKTLAIKMDDELHRKLKIYAVNQSKSVKDIIIELVKRELETKKEQTQ